MTVEAELVIIGAGVAGLSAAVTAGGHGLTPLVIERLAPGGQIATVESIRNFPSHPEGIGGFELGPLMQEQAEAHGARFMFGEVTGIEADGERFRIRLDDGDVVARAVIVATGSTRKALDVPGETQLEGRGISNCASCDGHFFAGKTVVVAGGGDSAFDEVDVLAELAKEVVIVHRGPEPVARHEARQRIAAHGNVRILAETEITAIHGDEAVRSVDVTSAGEAGTISCDGVFAYVGLAPNTALVRDLAELDGDGRAIVDEAMRTSTPGLFAAGDLRAGSACLLGASAGDGATAALAAHRYLTHDRAHG